VGEAQLEVDVALSLQEEALGVEAVTLPMVKRQKPTRLLHMKMREKLDN